MENRKVITPSISRTLYEVHLGSWKRHEEDNRFLTYLEFAEDLVAYVKETGFTHVEFMPIMGMILRGVSVSRLFCTDLSFWQSTRIYGAGRPIASSRNWRYSRLGTFPLPDDAHGLGFFDGSIF
jgi:1,4-alpha-glucan branching enzyme